MLQEILLHVWNTADPAVGLLAIIVLFSLRRQNAVIKVQTDLITSQKELLEKLSTISERLVAVETRLCDYVEQFRGQHNGNK